MTIFEDDRVKRDRTVSDEAYEITTPDGIWDVVLDAAGQFVVVPPPSLPESWRGNPTDKAAYDAWFAALPRSAVAVDAVAGILARY